MVTAFSSSTLSPSLLLLKNQSRVKPICLSTIKTTQNVQKEEIVIIGAGIAGLATSLSLHRLGVKSLVLEQADSLRTGGTSLTLFKNGWRVLDAMGVGDELREQFLEIEGLVIKAEDGRELRSFKFKDESEGQEVRAVERRILLETLTNKLPLETVRFSSKLAKIEKTGTGETFLELIDGTHLLAKIVIGCDGIRSQVAKWMGFSEPQYVGHCAFRGLAVYPGGQPFQPRVNYVYGRGLRAGYVPVSPTKVYWFICFNNPSPGPKITDTSVLKKEARDLVQNWPSEILDIIDKTPDDTISRTPLVDRWLWPTASPSASSGSVVLVGDAWHPMTPNLGQGACCALEDAVVLARKLTGTLDSGPTSLENALKSYESERWSRVFPLTIRANFVGSLLQWANPLVCSVRNNVVIPKLVRLGPLLEHTNFECKPLK
ncbi:Monooxygenase [Thalictrum thalictroides]|uniref:Monooxygenase n=1 Tax=Thalictrum thalictroides TaxID=46969 RepID=A0A7J6VSK7_THATH|nr:Monooxygenase [Thalictrum thalictroides]